MLPETDADLTECFLRAMECPETGVLPESASDNEVPPLVALTLAAQQKNPMALHLLLAMFHAKGEEVSRGALRALSATADANALIALSLPGAIERGSEGVVRRLMDTKGVLRQARPIVEQVHQRLIHRGRHQKPALALPVPPANARPESHEEPLSATDDPQVELLLASAATLERARQGILERLYRYDVELDRAWGSVEIIGIVLKISQRLEVIAREAVQLLAAHVGLDADQLAKAVTGSPLPLDRGSLGVLLLVLARLPSHGVPAAEALRADVCSSQSAFGQFVADRNRIAHSLDETRTDLAAMRQSISEREEARRKQLAFRQALRRIGDILRWMPSDWTMPHLEAVANADTSILPSTHLRRFEVRDELTVGRAQESTVRIDAAQISRCHVIVRGPTDEGPAQLLDRSSVGTLLNGESVLGSAPLSDGDTIGVGGFKFVYRDGSNGVRLDRANAIELPNA